MSLCFVFFLFFDESLPRKQGHGKRVGEFKVNPAAEVGKGRAGRNTGGGTHQCQPRAGLAVHVSRMVRNGPNPPVRSDKMQAIALHRRIGPSGREAECVFSLADSAGLSDVMMCPCCVFLCGLIIPLNDAGS